MRRSAEHSASFRSVLPNSSSAAWVAGRNCLQVFEKGRDAPEKHAGVPEIFSRRDIFLRHCQLGFFGEAAHRVRNRALVPADNVAALDVAVARFGPRRRNAEHHEIARMRARVRERRHELCDTSPRSSM